MLCIQYLKSLTKKKKKNVILFYLFLQHLCIVESYFFAFGYNNFLYNSKKHYWYCTDKKEDADEFCEMIQDRKWEERKVKVK